jgi:hypothetical protein
VKVYELLNLFAKDLTIGKHGIWWPSEALKIPFQWGGQIQKYRYPHEACYPLALLAEEVGCLQALAAHQMAPPIGDWAYFKTVVSEHPGAYWEDPCGAYGYRMADATSLPPGKVQPGDVAAQVKAVLGDSLQGSPGAWNDLNKVGNVINGYLVDMRRSGWDRLRWTGPLPQLPLYVEDRTQLLTDLTREGQFPYRERHEPYQEFYLDGTWRRGEREVVHRAHILDFPHAHSPRDTVLDLGTQVGGFLHHAHLLGLTRLVGVDSHPAYTDLAQRLARANGWNICYRTMPVEHPELLTWIRQLWPRTHGEPALTHLLLLSMLKHLSHTEQTLWEMVDALQACWTYLESNAVKEAHLAPLGTEVYRRGGILAGWSKDRNVRACYRVPGA